MTLLLPQSSWSAGWCGAGRRATHHAVRAASLVHYTRPWPQANHVGARFCRWGVGTSKERYFRQGGVFRPLPLLRQKPHPSQCPAHSLGPTF